MLLDRLYWTARLAWETPRQARFPFASPERILAAQRARLRRMVALAYRRVPFYREAMRARGLTPGDIRTVEDLERLPIIEREDLQHDLSRFLPDGRLPAHALIESTSGSSGMPREVYQDHAALMLNAAHGERQRSQWVRHIGQRVGYREALIASVTGSARSIQEHVAASHLVPRQMLVQRQYLDARTDMGEIVRALADFAPHVVHSYGSLLAELFAFLKRQGLRLPSLRLVTFSSDGLPDRARQLIQDKFGLPVYGTYQSTEALQLGFECEAQRGYHLNCDLYPLRVVDGEGRTLPPGESGEVVVSNLVNPGTVLFNYRLGDLATLSPEPCPCGRHLPLLQHIDGRQSEYFELASGRRLHSIQFASLLRRQPGVWQYQLTQTGPAACEVLLVTDPTTPQAVTEQAVRAAFTRDYGAELRLGTVAFVSSLPRLPNGKLRLFIPLGAAPSEGGQA